MARLIHRFGVALVVMLVLAGVVAGVYAYRTGRLFSSADHQSMQMEPLAAPAAATDSASSPGAVARGDVSIDPQRQQLIGVRLASVTRESMATVVRTTGVVRYDETRLTDVNVKLEGWIRDLRVDYTGQFVSRG